MQKKGSNCFLNILIIAIKWLIYLLLIISDIRHKRFPSVGHLIQICESREGRLSILEDDEEIDQEGKTVSQKYLYLKSQFFRKRYEDKNWRKPPNHSTLIKRHENSMQSTPRQKELKFEQKIRSDLLTFLPKNDLIFPVSNPNKGPFFRATLMLSVSVVVKPYYCVKQWGEINFGGKNRGGAEKNCGEKSRIFWLLWGANCCLRPTLQTFPLFPRHYFFPRWKLLCLISTIFGKGWRKEKKKIFFPPRNSMPLLIIFLFLPRSKRTFSNKLQSCLTPGQTGANKALSIRENQLITRVTSSAVKVIRSERPGKTNSIIMWPTPCVMILMGASSSLFLLGSFLP